MISCQIWGPEVLESCGLGACYFVPRCLHLEHVSTVEIESTAANLAVVLRRWTEYESVAGICADNAPNIQAADSK